MAHHATLYHTTLETHVKDIQNGIQLDRAKERTDFCREKHAFYLVDDEQKAKTVMAEEVGGFSAHQVAILKFSLNLEGLKVKTFSRELSGPSLKEWRDYVEYCRKYQKKGEQPPTPPPIVHEGYDVIVGWMSTRKGGAFEPLDSQVWQYAIITEKGVKALKLESVEVIKKT